MTDTGLAMMSGLFFSLVTFWTLNESCSGFALGTFGLKGIFGIARQLAFIITLLLEIRFTG